MVAGVVSIAMHPETTSTMYAGTAWSADLYKSTDGGMSWSLTGLSGQDLISDIEIDPTTPQSLYAGISKYAGTLKRSTNSGGSWISSTSGLPLESTGV
jgi:hypothetical protein